MKLNSLKSFFIASGLAIVALAAPAQELKIGYVNSDRVLREAAPAKTAQSKLEAEFGKREKELAEMGSRLTHGLTNRCRRPYRIGTMAASSTKI